MATRIRLRRVGRRKQPEFRIVVIQKTEARDGTAVETIGHYNPRTEPETLTVDRDKALAWLDRGATPSNTVRSLLKRAGVFGDAPVAAVAETAKTPEAPAEPATEGEAPESPAPSAAPPSEE